MKKCNVCGTQVDDSANYCTNCRSSDLSRIDTEQPSVFQTPEQPVLETEQQSAFNTEQQPAFNAEQQPAFNAEQEPAFNTEQQPAFNTEQQPAFNTEQPIVMEKDNGNIGKGVLGAFLFSIGGAVIYFLLFQLDTVASVSAIATFFLAKLGYDIFAKTKNKISPVRLIVSILFTAVMLLAAEYFCYSFEVFKLLEGEATFIESLLGTWYIIASESEIATKFWSDVLFCYFFGGLWLVFDIISEKKKLKKQQNQ